MTKKRDKPWRVRWTDSTGRRIGKPHNLYWTLEDAYATAVFCSLAEDADKPFIYRGEYRP